METCPHYLTFAAEEIADGATAFKCAPPIRDEPTVSACGKRLVDASIDLVATDHSPAPPALKHLDDGDFLRAWGGMASLQLGLPIVWTGAAERGVPWIGWRTGSPRPRPAGRPGGKGGDRRRTDADLVVFDPDCEWTVDARSLHHRHPVTPYDGRRLRGQVLTTILRGKTVFDRGDFASAPSVEP